MSEKKITESVPAGKEASVVMVVCCRRLSLSDDGSGRLCIVRAGQRRD